MSMFDDIQAKGKDVMNDPEKKAQIEQLAKEKGLTIEEAKTHYLQHNQQQ